MPSNDNFSPAAAPAQTTSVDERSRSALAVLDGKAKVEGLKPISAQTRCKFILIEQRPFLRECLSRSLTSSVTVAIAAFASIGDYLAASDIDAGCLVVLSVARITDADAKQQLAALVSARPDFAIVVLTQDDDATGAQEAFTTGAVGYIPMALGFEQVIAALSFISAGGTYVPAEYILALRKPPDASDLVGCGDNEREVKLTTRQAQVLKLICEGKSNKQIARDLGVAENTVKVHAYTLARLFGIHDRRLFAARAQQKH